MREARRAASLTRLVLGCVNIWRKHLSISARRERLATRLSEVADGVAETYAAADLGREVFDEGEVVAVEAVAEVEGVDREDLRVVLVRDVFDEGEVVAVEAVAEVEGVDREDLRVVLV